MVFAKLVISVLCVALAVIGRAEAQEPQTRETLFTDDIGRWHINCWKDNVENTSSCLAVADAYDRPVVELGEAGFIEFVQKRNGLHFVIYERHESCFVGATQVPSMVKKFPADEIIMRAQSLLPLHLKLKDTTIDGVRLFSWYGDESVREIMVYEEPVYIRMKSGRDTIDLTFDANGYAEACKTFLSAREKFLAQ